MKHDPSLEDVIKLIHIDRVDNKVIGDDPETGHDRFVTEKDQEMILELYGIEYLFVLKAGFMYDGASTPGAATFLGSFIHWQIDSNSALKTESAFHDAFYIYQGVLTRDNPHVEVYLGDKRVAITLERAQVEYIYYLCMMYDEERIVHDPDNPDGTRSMSDKEVWAVYKALRKAGGSRWDKKKLARRRKITKWIHKVRKFFFPNATRI